MISKKSIRSIRILCYFVMGGIVLSMALIFVIKDQLYRATFDYKDQEENIYSHYSSLFYSANGKNIEALYNNRGDKDVFIYFHGNTGRKSYILDYLYENTSFIAPAYPGYHRSEGKPSVTGTLESVDEFLPVLTQEFRDDVRFHVIGHSLGSQTASYFAHLLKDNEQLKSLSLVAGFPDIRSQCENTIGVFGFLCFPANDSFNASNYLMDIGDITVRVYHLFADEKIPYRDGLTLFKNIAISSENNKKQKIFYDLTSGDHGDFDMEMVVNNALGK